MPTSVLSVMAKVTFVLYSYLKILLSVKNARSLLLLSIIKPVSLVCIFRLSNHKLRIKLGIEGMGHQGKKESVKFVMMV